MLDVFNTPLLRVGKFLGAAHAVGLGHAHIASHALIGFDDFDFVLPEHLLIVGKHVVVAFLGVGIGIPGGLVGGFEVFHLTAQDAVVDFQRTHILVPLGCEPYAFKDFPCLLCLDGVCIAHVVEGFFVELAPLGKVSVAVVTLTCAVCDNLHGLAHGFHHDLPFLVKACLYLDSAGVGLLARNLQLLVEVVPQCPYLVVKHHVDDTAGLCLDALSGGRIVDHAHEPLDFIRGHVVDISSAHHRLGKTDDVVDGTLVVLLALALYAACLHRCLEVVGNGGKFPDETTDDLLLGFLVGSAVGGCLEQRLKDLFLMGHLSGIKAGSLFVGHCTLLKDFLGDAVLIVHRAQLGVVLVVGVAQVVDLVAQVIDAVHDGGSVSGVCGRIVKGEQSVSLLDKLVLALPVCLDLLAQSISLGKVGVGDDGCIGTVFIGIVVPVATTLQRVADIVFAQVKPLAQGNQIAIIIIGYGRIL